MVKENQQVRGAVAKKPGLLEEARAKFSTVRIMVGDKALRLIGIDAEEEVAAYQVISDEGDSIVIMSKDDKGYEDKITITFEGDDLMRVLCEGEEEEVFFIRQE